MLLTIAEAVIQRTWPNKLSLAQLLMQDEADAKAVADIEEASWHPPADQKTAKGLVQPSLTDLPACS